MPPRVAMVAHLVLAVVTIGAVTALAWKGAVPASSALLVITSASGLSILGTTTSQAQGTNSQTTERVTTMTLPAPEQQRPAPPTSPQG